MAKYSFMKGFHARVSKVLIKILKNAKKPEAEKSYLFLFRTKKIKLYWKVCQQLLGTERGYFRHRKEE